MKTKQDGNNQSTDEESLDLLSIYGEAKRAPAPVQYVLSSIIGARKIHKINRNFGITTLSDGRFRGEYIFAD